MRSLNQRGLAPIVIIAILAVLSAAIIFKLPETKMPQLLNLHAILFVNR